MNGLEICEYTDCSEIAEQLLKATGQGTILQVTPAPGTQLQLMEFGHLDAGFVYHEVYSAGGFVYDPRLSSQPVPVEWPPGPRWS